MQIKLTSTYQLKRGTCQKKRDRLFAQLPITLACLICNYIFTQQRGVAAITSTHLFMKSSRLKSTVPPGHCLQRCQQHSTLNNSTHRLNLPWRHCCCPPTPLNSHTHMHTLLLLMINHCMHSKGLVDNVLTGYICKEMFFLFLSSENEEQSKPHFYFLQTKACLAQRCYTYE